MEASRSSNINLSTEEQIKYHSLPKTSQIIYPEITIVTLFTLFHISMLIDRVVERNIVRFAVSKPEQIISQRRMVKRLVACGIKLDIP